MVFPLRCSRIVPANTAAYTRVTAERPEAGATSGPAWAGKVGNTSLLYPGLCSVRDPTRGAVKSVGLTRADIEGFVHRRRPDDEEWDEARGLTARQGNRRPCTRSTGSQEWRCAESLVCVRLRIRKANKTLIVGS